MAITEGSTSARLDGTSKTAGTSLTATLTTAVMAAGTTVILTIAADNIQTTDGTSTLVSGITDSRSNVYEKLGEFTNGAAAAAGATVSVWKSLLTTQLEINDTLTVTFANSITAKALIGRNFAHAANTTLDLVAGSTQTIADDGVDASSLTISGLPSKEYLFYRGIASERDISGFFVTRTSGWGPLHTFGDTGTSGGGNASNMSATGEYTISTGTGATSNPTTSAHDQASILMAIEEVSPPASFPATNTSLRTNLSNLVR